MKNKFVSYCGHKTDTFFPDPDGDQELRNTKGFIVTFPEHKKTPRVKYIKEFVNSFSYKLIPDYVKDLSIALPGKNSIVSRDTLRAVRALEKKVLTSYPELKKVVDIRRINKLSFEALSSKFPELLLILETVGTRAQQRELYNSIKLYVGRDDLYAPGQQVRDNDNKIIAAWMLISDLDSYEAI